MTLTRTRRAATLLAATAVAVAGLSACSSSGGSSPKSSGAAGSSTGSSAATSNSKPSTVNLVAYSVPKPAYDALSDAFAKTADGKNVTIKASYGPSGTQAKNVLAGQKADYVAFSTGVDMSKLVPKYVDSSWDSGATKGIVSHSVVVIVVRKGNPKKITGWDDLIKNNIKIVTPSPSTSGSAKWNILAAYEHVIQQGGTPAQAEAYLKQFYKHIVSRAQSGSAATAQFVGGTGDVLISYEDEAIAARAAGKPVDYIVPDQSVLIENPVAVTKGAPASATAFLNFAMSTAGQQIFVSKGFRPVSDSTPVGTVQGAMDPSKPFPTVKNLITISSLGGWSAVQTKFFGDNGIDTKIEGSG